MNGETVWKLDDPKVVLQRFNHCRLASSENGSLEIWFSIICHVISFQLQNKPSNKYPSMFPRYRTRTEYHNFSWIRLIVSSKSICIDKPVNLIFYSNQQLRRYEFTISSDEQRTFPMSFKRSCIVHGDLLWYEFHISPSNWFFSLSSTSSSSSSSWPLINSYNLF